MFSQSRRPPSHCQPSREVLDRKINACPGPQELFRVVSEVTARHLAEVPFPLPDISAVLAEGTSVQPLHVWGVLGECTQWAFLSRAWGCMQWVENMRLQLCEEHAVPIKRAPATVLRTCRSDQMCAGVFRM